MPTCTAQADPFTAVCPGQRHAVYRELARGGPIHRITLPTGQPVWLVTGYREAREALTDPRLAKGASPATRRAWELVPDSLRDNARRGLAGFGAGVVVMAALAAALNV